MGGADAAIRVISREEGSGTRRSFDKLVLKGDKLTPKRALPGLQRHGARGGRDRSERDRLRLHRPRERQGEGARLRRRSAHERRTCGLGRYPLSRPIFFLTKGELPANVQAFVDYVLSPEAQHMLEQEGLIAAK